MQVLRAEKNSSSSNGKMESIPTPYAVEAFSSETPPSANVEGEAIWRRMRDAIVHNLDKLGQIFFKVDITASGTVTQDEFELALSHIGVLFTRREVERLYETMPMEL